MVNEQVSRGYGSSPSSAPVRLVLDRLTVENSSSFHLSKMVCRALQTRGYHVLIGPPDPSLRQVNFHFLCFTDLCGFSAKKRVASQAEAMLPFRVCYVRVVSPNDMLVVFGQDDGENLYALCSLINLQTLCLNSVFSPLCKILNRHL